jgi:hypothetical protein
MKARSVVDSLARVCTRHRIQIDISERELPQPRQDVSTTLAAVEQALDALNRAFHSTHPIGQQ